MTQQGATVTKTGLVVAHHPLTAQAGLEILEQGGNAVDAAVCAAFVNSVVRPGMNGLGGFGGCMIIFLNDTRRVVAIDYSTVAPEKARAGMYQPIADGEIADDSRMGREYPVLPGYATRNDENITGYRAISVPPQPAGLTLALEEFGTKTLQAVLAPAIEIAREGFALDPLAVATIERTLPYLSQFPVTLKTLAPEGRTPRVGDWFTNAALADTMQIMAEQGTDSFYSGSIADVMVTHIREHGGILSHKDLQDYRARIEAAPSMGEYRGHEVYTPSLYSGGGATILQILNILEGFDLTRLGAASSELIHLMIEATKLAWDDRLAHMGDPAYMHIPEQTFISKAHAMRQRALLERTLKKANVSSDESGSSISGVGHTTHLNVMDEQGNTVSLTETDGWAFGSLVTIPGLGFNMNNGMSSFDPRHGRVNSIAPCKRPISRMCPVVVLKGGQPLFAIGAGGGRRIMNIIAQILVDLIDFGLSAQEAVEAPRFHCEQGEPILLEHGPHLDWGFPSQLVDTLREIGHQVRGTGDQPDPLGWRLANPSLIAHDPIKGERTGAFRYLPMVSGAAAGH